MTAPTLTRVRGVSSESNPLAYQQGLWEVVVDEVGEDRWFGPDTLFACLEAQHTLEGIARTVAEPKS